MKRISGFEGLAHTLSKQKLHSTAGIRRALSALSHEGIGPKVRAKHVLDKVNKGFQYMENGAASQLQKTGAEKQLQLAVMAIGAESLAAKKTAHKKASIFLTDGTSEQVNEKIQTMPSLLQRLLNSDKADGLSEMPSRIRPTDLKEYLQKDIYRIAMKHHIEYVVLKFYQAGKRDYKRLARSTERAFHDRRDKNTAYGQKLTKLMGASRDFNEQGRENRDEHAKRCRRESLPENDGDRHPCGPDAEAATERARRESDRRDVAIIEEKLLPPGAWRCNKCHSAVLAASGNCGGRVAGEPCSGTQMTTWGGYIVRPTTMQTMRCENRPLFSYLRKAAVQRHASRAKKKRRERSTDRTCSRCSAENH